MKLRWLALPLLALTAWSIAAHPWGWLYGIGVHPYPQSSSTPWSYQLLSGFVPALAVLTLLGSVTALWRHVNCAQEHCWHLGRHKVAGTPWCDRHHENARPQQSIEEILLELSAKFDALADELRADREAR